MIDQPVPTNIPRRHLGCQLREIRQGAGLSIENMARLLGRGATTIQRLETGTASTIRMSDVEGICQFSNAEDELPRLKRLVAEIEAADDGLWHMDHDDRYENFATYLSLEASSTTMTQYQGVLCPGLLQTPDYARALARMSAMDPEEVELSAQVRATRQRRLTRSRDPLNLDVIIEESVLRRVVGSPALMADQVRKLADVPANVQLRVVPIGAPYPHSQLVAAYVILEPVGEQPVVHVEQMSGCLFYSRPETVMEYRRAHAAAQRVALSVSDSKLLLRRIAADHARAAAASRTRSGSSAPGVRPAVNVTR
ncbi:helix-turn-helix domain-containing protein [Nocardia cyriacigeorgica]|uniref:Helix-turn-helix domain-containing protein n=2 Tax=Nocardia cyriacigeorgica TaxID=135487 RepID=A0A6P1CI53_9NOCA|nr:helix-turn-helix transcriptional regulator [Nocardia cyriacigeorgica]MBF6286820.1 helix-turn-helix domain-containing protein [Nocardia cyriacigeorgica]NEW32299.1 helix-turn-helix domain-containing protein [Nocardia cyriacigeorgica]CCF62774.1 putative Transcriptional regulator, XRE family [Nocardia cyriacigeorgica GUH-2]